ncbi:MAG TPA: accessory factor UbiK family protein [Methylotenera sp.]|nr:accessory factor UbiK family protein [Methylotenera sp.]HPH04634.1 accessory factor UbiK family protein [Methylotenera sp.]HPN01648.1 accessory factor UbiK family protein [Methylotenera sp.]
MLNASKLDEISSKIKDMVHKTPITYLDKNFHALIQGVLTKMELVSREEFEVQAEALRHTREKLVNLEAQLAKLESLQKTPSQ